MTYLLDYENAEKNHKIVKDKYNLILLVCSGIIVFSNINTINLTFDISKKVDNFVWIDLLNWLPLFLLFAFVQDYLKEESSIEKVKDNFFYNSGTNDKFLNIYEIRDLIKENIDPNIIIDFARLLDRGFFYL